MKTTRTTRAPSAPRSSAATPRRRSPGRVRTQVDAIHHCFSWRHADHASSVLAELAKMVIPEPHTGHTDMCPSAPVQVSFVYLVEPWTILMFIFSLAMAMCGNVTSPKDVCELKTEISLWLGCTEPLGTPRVMQLLEPKRWVWMSIAIFISYWCLRLLLSIPKLPLNHTSSVMFLVI